MGVRELKKRYGGNSKQAVGAAIRAEMVGGDDLLDALPLIHRLVTRLRDRDLAGVDSAQAALDQLVELRELMGSIVLQRSDEAE